MNKKLKGCKTSENDREGMWPTLAYKAIFELQFDNFLKNPFLKRKILRSSERGVNSILTTILQFWQTSWRDRIFCLVASDSACREDHFQKKICPKRTFPSNFLKPFLKGKILRSSERGVNSILTTILRFWPTSWRDRLFCLVASDSARRKDHFQKKICPKRTFPSNFVKLVSKILYLFLAEKMVVCCLLLSQFFVRFWLTFFLNWSTRRAEKDVFKEKIIRSTV